jgi:transgelin
MADVTVGLAVTVAEKDKLKYEQQKDEEQKIRSWVASMLPSRTGILENSSLSLHAILKDGSVICELLNSIIENEEKEEIKKLKISRIHRPGLPFKEMENITTYLNTCKKLGLAKEFCFETNDLHDGKGMTYVLNNLSMLRRLVTNRGLESPFTVSTPLPSTSVSDLSAPSSPNPRKRSPPRSPNPHRAQSGTFRSPLSSPKSVRSSRNNDDVQDEDEGGEYFGRDDGDGYDSPVSFFQQDSGTGSERSSVGFGPSVPSLDDDMKTKASFSYNSELEKIVKDWIETILGKSTFDNSQTFGDNLKSGVILCNLVNKIQPYIIKKVHDSQVAYKQIENIGNYIKACSQLGLPRQDTFDVPDLYNEKNLTLVLESIHRFARYVTNILKVANIPPIRNPSSIDLWTSTLVETGTPVEMVDGIELSPEQQNLLAWLNYHLHFDSTDGGGLTQMTELRTGLYILQLLEVLSGGPVGGYNREPTSTWHYMQNVSLIFRFLSTQFMERVPESSEADVVMGKLPAITNLLRYVRLKYDRDFFVKTEVRSSVLEMFGEHNIDDEEFVQSVLEELNLDDDEEKMLDELEKYLGKLSKTASNSNSSTSASASSKD